MTTELQDLRRKKAEWLTDAQVSGKIDGAIQVAETLGENITESQFYRSPRRHSELVKEWTHEAVSVRVFWKCSNQVRDANRKMIRNILRTVQITVSGHLVCDVQVGPKPDADRDDFWVPGVWEETLTEAYTQVKRISERKGKIGDARELSALRKQLLVGVKI